MATDFPKDYFEREGKISGAEQDILFTIGSAPGILASEIPEMVDDHQGEGIIPQARMRSALRYLEENTFVAQRNEHYRLTRKGFAEVRMSRSEFASLKLTPEELARHPSLSREEFASLRPPPKEDYNA